MGLMQSQIKSKLGRKYTDYTNDILKLIETGGDKKKLEKIRRSIGVKIGLDLKKKGNVLAVPDIVRFSQIIGSSKTWEDCKIRLVSEFSQFASAPAKLFKIFDYNWKISFEVPEQELTTKKRTTVKDLRRELIRRNEEMQELRLKAKELERALLREKEKTVKLADEAAGTNKEIVAGADTRKVVITIEVIK